MNRYFSEDEMQMDNKYLKKYSASFHQMQILGKNGTTNQNKTMSNLL